MGIQSLETLELYKDTKWLNQSNAGETFFSIERSPERRQKQSITMTGKKFGPQSEEQKRNTSIRMTGVKRGPQSPEHKAKRAASRRGVPSPVKGKKQSPETIAKRTGKKRRPYKTKRNQL